MQNKLISFQHYRIMPTELTAGMFTSGLHLHFLSHSHRVYRHSLRGPSTLNHFMNWHALPPVCTVESHLCATSVLPKVVCLFSGTIASQQDVCGFELCPCSFPFGGRLASCLCGFPPAAADSSHCQNTCSAGQNKFQNCPKV